MFRNPVTDLIVVLVVALVIFGPKRLPMLGRALGQGLKEFKEGITGEGGNDERPALTPPTADEPGAAPTRATPASVAGESEPAEAASSERRL